MKTCLDCPFHKIIDDPDLWGSWCIDDVAIVCTKKINPDRNVNSRHASDRSEYDSVAVACRPYNLKNEAIIPEWCPEGYYKTDQKKSKINDDILIL